MVMRGSDYGRAQGVGRSEIIAKGGTLWHSSKKETMYKDNITQPIDERLRELTESTKPDHVDFLPNFESDLTFDECKQDAVNTINALDVYIANGHSAEGLDIKRLSVRKN